jgi:hypothetical protein
MKKNMIIESEDSEQQPTAQRKTEKVDELQMEVEKVYPTDEYGKGIIPLTSEIMEKLDVTIGEPLKLKEKEKQLPAFGKQIF